MKAVATVAAAVLAAFPAPGAAAENGIKIGDGRLHPYLALEGRYDSNVLYGAGQVPVGDLVLHLKPGFDLQIPGNQLSVDFGANLDWNKYLGLKSEATKDLSHLFAEATLALAANRLGTVGLELDDAFRRSDRTGSYSIATAVVSNYNDLRLAVPFRPGGGALAVTVGGQWLLETFETFMSGSQCGPTGTLACDTLGYSQIAGRGEVRWKFLPRTALALEASYFVRIPKDAAVSKDVKGLKTLAGLAGLITPHIAATVKGGYGDTFGSAGTPYRTWLANVEIEYVTMGTAGGRVGYVHEYSADPVNELSLYGVHRIYLEGKMLLGGRLTASVRAEYDSIQYALVAASLQVAQLTPKLEVEVTRWLYAAAGYGLTWRSGSSIPAPVLGFTKNEAWLSAKLVY